MILQRVYIAVLNTIFKLTGLISEKVREALIFVCLLYPAFIYSFAPRSSAIEESMLIGAVILCLITVLSVNDKLKVIRWNYLTYIPLILFGAGILIISKLHFVGEGYTLFAMALIFLFPAFYLVWNNREDHETFYDLLALAFAVSGFACFVYNYYLAFHGGYEIWPSGREAGCTKNPNYLGMVGLTMAVACLYLLFRSKKIYQAILLSVLAGFGFSMIGGSISRTAIVSIILSSISFIVFAFKRSGKEFKGTGIRARSLPFVIAVLVIAAYGGSYIDDVQVKAEAALAEVQETEAEGASFASGGNDSSFILTSEEGSGKEYYSDSAKVSVSVISADYSVSHQDASLVLTSGESDSEESDDLKEIGDRFIPGEDVNRYTNGRIGIWKMYISNLSLLGKDINDPVQPEDGSEPVKLDRAHNNILDYAYRVGIVSLLYIWLYICIGIMALIHVIRKRSTRPWMFLFSAVVFSYAFYSLVEISDLPFTRCVPFLFFMVIGPVFARKKDQDN